MRSASAWPVARRGKWILRLGGLVHAHKRSKGLIRSLFQLRYADKATRDRQYVHVQWLTESLIGSKGELFLQVGAFQDVPLALVVAKLDFVYRPGNALPTQKYYCRYVLGVCAG
jgi:hypothetical protein